MAVLYIFSGWDSTCVPCVCVCVCSCLHVWSILVYNMSVLNLGVVCSDTVQTSYLVIEWLIHWILMWLVCTLTRDLNLIQKHREPIANFWFHTIGVY